MCLGSPRNDSPMTVNVNRMPVKILSSEKYKIKNNQSKPFSIDDDDDNDNQNHNQNNDDDSDDDVPSFMSIMNVNSKSKRSPKHANRSKDYKKENENNDNDSYNNTSADYDSKDQNNHSSESDEYADNGRTQYNNNTHNKTTSTKHSPSKLNKAHDSSDNENLPAPKSSAKSPARSSFSSSKKSLKSSQKSPKSSVKSFFKPSTSIKELWESYDKEINTNGRLEKVGTCRWMGMYINLYIIIDIRLRFYKHPFIYETCVHICIYPYASIGAPPLHSN